MLKKSMIGTPVDKGKVGTVHNRAEKRQRSLQRLFDSMPAQIDAIREKRGNDAIELRRFMIKREKNRKKQRIKYSALKWIDCTRRSDFKDLLQASLAAPDLNSGCDL